MAVRQAQVPFYWQPLTDDQKATLVAGLKRLTHHSVELHCNYRNVDCQFLATDLLDVFQDADWEIKRFARSTSIDLSGLRVFGSADLDADITAVKEALRTTLRIVIPMNNEVAPDELVATAEITVLVGRRPIDIVYPPMKQRT
jgi:hypothetical protein